MWKERVKEIRSLGLQRPPTEAFEIRRRNQYIQISSCLPKETEIGSWTNKTLTVGINRNWKNFLLVQWNQRGKKNDELWVFFNGKKKPIFV